MYKIPKEYIIEKIKEKSNLSQEEINTKIKQKLDELSGLISEEGAAHIIANELGINLTEPQEKQAIKNIFAGMRNVEVVGKVTNVFEVREFQTPQRSGKVGSFMIGDETGQLRIVCWGDKADTLEKLSEGLIIKIKSGYSRDNNGRIELHLNDNSEVILNPEGETVGEVKTRTEANRKKISELTEKDQNTAILGTVVSAFDPRFFEVCTKCGKRARPQDGTFMCEEHGAVESPDYSYVMNAILDDGTDNIRTVFFKNQMQHLVNLTHEEILAKKDSDFEDLKTDLLGKIIKVIGRAVNNEMFSRLEFIAQIVDQNPNPDNEIKRMEEEEKKAAQSSLVSEEAPKEEAQTTEETISKAPIDEEIKPAVAEIKEQEETQVGVTQEESITNEEVKPQEQQPSAEQPQQETPQIKEETTTEESQPKKIPEDTEEEAVSIDELDDLSDDDIYE